jgi:hypothetical protein
MVTVGYRGLSTEFSKPGFRMDCRVKPGNDQESDYAAAAARAF